MQNKMQLDGIGNLYQKLEALKKKLTEEGCFDKANKKSIPKFPKKKLQFNSEYRCRNSRVSIQR